METAVDDGLIKRNACRIKGVGKGKAAERRIATVAQDGAPLPTTSAPAAATSTWTR